MSRRTKRARGAAGAAWVAALACASCSAAGSGEGTAEWVAEIDGRAQAYDWTGYSMARAGDVNGDGHDDLLVSALSSGEGGRVALFLGPLSGFIRAESAVASFVGDQTFVNLGDSILQAGGCDVNGDGYDDVILGSPFSDGPVSGTTSSSGDNRGRARLHLGGPSLTGTVGAGDAALTLIGEADYDTLGSTVACLGDLDADGLDDFAIAAKGAGRRGRSDSGAVYVLYGRRDFSGTSSIDAAADAVLVGAEAFEQAGYAVALAGDLDGDGHADLAIGAPFHGSSAADAGAVYLVRGDGARLAGELGLEGAQRLVAGRPHLGAGWVLDRGGDLDGDGIDDLLVGSHVLPMADGTSETGSAWIVYGGDALASVSTLDDAGTRIDGAEPGALVGAAVAGVHDLTGDGVDDLVVGAIGARSSAGEVGRVHLVAGARARARVVIAGEVERWHEDGPGADAHFAENIAWLGDIDGDGAASDFAVGSKALATTAEGAGALLIYRTRRR